MKKYSVIALVSLVPALFAGATKKCDPSEQSTYVLFSKKHSRAIEELCSKKNHTYLHHMRVNDLEKRALMLELDSSDILLRSAVNPEKKSSHLEWSEKEFLQLDIDQ